MVYSDYSQRGYDLVETEIISEQWKPLHQVNNNSAKLYSELVKQEEKVLQAKDIPETDYDVKSYSKLGNLFNFHSWTPFYYDYENLNFENPEIYPGVTFVSQNKLSTAFTYMGYAFEEGDHHFKPKFIYKGWYPVFEIQADYGGIPRVYTGSNTSTYPVLSI